MTDQRTVRIAAVSPEFVDRADGTALADWLSYFDPGVVLLTGESAAPRAASRLRRQMAQETIVAHPAGRTGSARVHTVDCLQFVFAPTTEALREIRELEHQRVDTDAPVFVVSGLLELAVDTTSLSTSLVGREEYVAALDPAQLDGEYVHISARLPAEYRREWDGLTVLGGGRESGYGDTPLVALDCRADGCVLTRSLNRSQLGLRALDGVGRTRARTLREAGFRDRAAVASADIETLASLDGIGRKTAERVTESAEAIDTGRVVRRSEAPLPDGDPVYVDIETDGLSPTITWLVGVLDGGSEEGTYRSFLATDPDEPGRAVETFMTWYTGTASNRPLVAYNGWQFDFPVLEEHIVEYCPHYEDDWASTYRFDPYRWAADEGNAVLPGRTNKLGDVTAALGHDRAETGLTGAAVARAYRRWMDERSPGTEPDWERFDRYCEDDVRGLATVYEALESSRRVVSASSSRETAETTQRTLSDW
jgi:uncharacterized protein YprB with RNaseH-like and TPR domain